MSKLTNPKSLADVLANALMGNSFRTEADTATQMRVLRQVRKTKRVLHSLVERKVTRITARKGTFF